MDPIGNPYTPNAGSRPPELAGRAGELEQFRVLVGRLKRGATEQSMIVRHAISGTQLHAAQVLSAEPLSSSRYFFQRRHRRIVPLRPRSRGTQLRLGTLGRRALLENSEASSSGVQTMRGGAVFAPTTHSSRRRRQANSLYGQ